MHKDNVDLKEKIEVARVFIERTHGRHAKAFVSSFQAANNVLQSWVESVPEKGGIPCLVQITFEDGLQYRCKIELQRSRKRIFLGWHVRRELSALASLESRHPQLNMPRPFRVPCHTDRSPQAQTILEDYEI